MFKDCKMHKELLEIDRIEYLSFSEVRRLDETELDYYNDELFMGFKLVNEDGKFVLKVRRDNMPGSYIERYIWPGTKEDYDRFLDQIADGMNELIPRIFIYLLEG